jgi:CheY-like chemotaxis protein
VNRTVRVLVAEDNEDHRFLITRALRAIEGADLEVEAVRDGAEALDFVYQREGFEDRPRPHLILLDLRMPRVHGIEVLDILKNDPELRSIPIAVLTSSDRQQDIDDSYRAGTNTYVQKRPMFGDLREKLQALSEFWTHVALLPEPPG